MSDDDPLKKPAEAGSTSQEPPQPPQLPPATDLAAASETPEFVPGDADQAETWPGDAEPPAPAVDVPAVDVPDFAALHAERSDAGVTEVVPARSRRRISLRSPRQAIEPEAAPPPPVRSRQARHPLVVVLNFFMMASVLAVLVLGAGLYFGSKRFNAAGPLTDSKTVLVSRGADLESIAGLLQRQNVIDSSFVFSTGVRLSKAADKLQAGEYLFEAGISMRDVMNALVSGKAILHAFTLPEGLTSQQVVDRLLANTVLTGELGAVPAEGTLFPETYKFSRGATRQQIIEQMRRAQERIVAEIWERRSPDLPISTPAEFVTLASIVEKETGKADERPRVAAVFINRLRQNIRLQSDPTIIYGLFGGKGKPSDRPIFRSDIDTKTPYNTYQIDGLPPGPIANPGRAALEAVANPSRTDDLYFVADGTGGHLFATTLEEHNRNVARWRRIEAERRKAEEARQAAEAAARQEAADGDADGATGTGDAESAAEDGAALDATGAAGGAVLPKAKPQ